ncbi:MAG: RtcB family protein [Desulfovibrio sp.]|nr:RtcB family protein [Desulfovibrio sp.]
MKTITLHGKFTDAAIYTVDNEDVAIEGYALAQIQQLCDLEACAGNAVRVMPDVHPGKGCVIGLTMTLSSDKVMPGLVGVDIGCGVSAARLGKYAPNFPKLDRIIA